MDQNTISPDVRTSVDAGNGMDIAHIRVSSSVVSSAPATGTTNRFWAPVFSGTVLAPVSRDRVGYQQTVFESLIDYERRHSRRTGEPATLLLCSFERIDVSGRDLRRLVQTIQRVVRETDHIGWYGNKRLAVILSGTDVDNAASVCAKLSQESELLRARDLEIQPL